MNHQSNVLDVRAMQNASLLRALTAATRNQPSVQPEATPPFQAVFLSGIKSVYVASSTSKTQYFLEILPDKCIMILVKDKTRKRISWIYESSTYLLNNDPAPTTIQTFFHKMLKQISKEIQNGQAEVLERKGNQ